MNAVVPTNSLPETGKIICNKIIDNKTIFCHLDTPLLIWQVWEHYKKKTWVIIMVNIFKFKSK